MIRAAHDRPRRHSGPRRPAAAAAAAAGLALAAATAVPAEPGPDADPALQAVIDAEYRSEAFRARDAARHPFATLRFFGLREGMDVVEIWPGLGWYAELLAPYASRTGGTYTAVNYVPPDVVPPRWFERSAVILQARVDAEVEVLGNARLTGYQTGMDAPLAPVPLNGIGPPGGADLVLSFRDAHLWLAIGALDEFLTAAFEALRPGGVLGVVDHRAPDDWTVERMIAHGYVSEALITARALAAGFVADGSAPINANPEDMRDHPAGVWTLPPSMRLGETEQARYLGIGEPDRFTLRYRKPEG